MSSFTEATFERIPEQRDGRDQFRVTGLRFYIGYEGSGLCVVVPDGFLTDGPSVPSWVFTLVNLLPRRVQRGIGLDRIVKSSAVHDCLREDARFTSKLATDMIFATAMESERAPYWIRLVAYFAVRMNTSRENHQPVIVGDNQD